MLEIQRSTTFRLVHKTGAVVLLVANPVSQSCLDISWHRCSSLRVWILYPVAVGGDSTEALRENDFTESSITVSTSSGQLSAPLATWQNQESASVVGVTPEPPNSRQSHTSNANMPTPESELFLKAKPTVPPTFHNVDMKDHEAVVNARDAIIREQWVQIMMKRLVGQELGKCYRKEGVNHLEKCGKYRGKQAARSEVYS